MAKIATYQTDWVTITQVYQTLYIDPVTEAVTYAYETTSQVTIDKNRISAVGEFINPESNQIVPDVRAIYYSESPFTFLTNETLATLQGWVNAIDCTKLCTDT